MVVPTILPVRASTESPGGRPVAVKLSGLCRTLDRVVNGRRFVHSVPVAVVVEGDELVLRQHLVVNTEIIDFSVEGSSDVGPRAPHAESQLIVVASVFGKDGNGLVGSPSTCIDASFDPVYPMIDNSTVVSTGDVNPTIIHTLGDFNLHIPRIVLRAESSGASAPESPNRPFGTKRSQTIVMSSHTVQAGFAFIVLSGVRHEPKGNGPWLGSVYAQGIGKGIGLDPFVRAELDRISEFTGRGESRQVARVALQGSRESSEVGRCRGTTGLFEPEPCGHGIFGNRRRTDRITYA